MEPTGKYTQVDSANPQAFGICDLCGRRFNFVDLRWNYEWSGTHLFNTRSLRCWRCVDVPQEQFRTIFLPPDPPPIVNARTENFAYEESTVRILQYNQPKLPPWGAGPQTLRALQDGETPRILEYSSEANIGRVTDQPLFPGKMTGAEIMEIMVPGGTPNTPADGRLTSLPPFSGQLTGTEVLELISTGIGLLGVEPANIIPLDGRLSSLQLFAIAMAGTEVMEMVTPNNAQSGQNYQITTALLGAFFATFQFVNPTQVAQGSTYLAKNTDARLLIKSGANAPTSIIMPLSATMVAPFPILIKDLVGDAFNNNATITFSGGEEVDGQASLVIDNNYGWVTINPLPGGNGWYQS